MAEFINKNDHMNNEIYKRKITTRIEKWLHRPEILVITGPRQVGKTFLANKILPHLVKLPIKYFNFESLDTRELFKKDPQNFIENLLDKKDCYVFDEFQKAPELTASLKFFYDKNKNDFPKIFLTGSSSPEIQKNISESLVGQSLTFNLLSLSFSEKFNYASFDFLEKICQNRDFKINELKKKLFLQQKELQRNFEEYLLLGGYPELGELEADKKWEKIKSILETVLDRDLQNILKNEHLFSSKKLLEILAHRLGNIISFENLASELQLNIKTVKKIISVLEGLFFFKLIYPKANFANEYKKAPKVFFEDLGMRNELIKMHYLPVDSSQIGGLVENFIFGQLRRYSLYQKDFKINFWRDYNDNEVDFVLTCENKLISIEVKYQKGQTARVPAGIQNFIKKYHPLFHITATYDYFGETEIDGCKIFFIPVYAFGLII